MAYIKKLDVLKMMRRWNQFKETRQRMSKKREDFQIHHEKYITMLEREDMLTQVFRHLNKKKYFKYKVGSAVSL